MQPRRTTVEDDGDWAGLEEQIRVERMEDGGREETGLMLLFCSTGRWSREANAMRADNANKQQPKSKNKQRLLALMVFLFSILSQNPV